MHIGTFQDRSDAEAHLHQPFLAPNQCKPSITRPAGIATGRPFPPTRLISSGTILYSKGEALKADCQTLCWTHFFCFVTLALAEVATFAGVSGFFLTVKIGRMIFQASRTVQRTSLAAVP